MKKLILRKCVIGSLVLLMAITSVSASPNNTRKETNGDLVKKAVMKQSTSVSASAKKAYDTAYSNKDSCTTSGTLYRPGRYIYTSFLDSDGNENVSYGSIGFRAKMKINGIMKEGFVTAGHVLFDAKKSKMYDVYATYHAKTNSASNVIGRFRPQDVRYTGQFPEGDKNIDVGFVYFIGDNGISSYMRYDTKIDPDIEEGTDNMKELVDEPANFVRSKQLTNGVFLKLSTLYNVYKKNPNVKNVIKCGSTTGLTNGKLNSTSRTLGPHGYYTVQTDILCSPGDSGGIVCGVDNGKKIPIGIVQGYNNYKVWNASVGREVDAWGMTFTTRYDIENEYNKDGTVFEVY